MRAAVLVDVGRIEVRDVPRVAPAPHEIVVRVQAVGLCGTDIHIAGGHANYNRDEHGRARSLHEHPQILGHENLNTTARYTRRTQDQLEARATPRILSAGLNCCHPLEDFFGRLPDRTGDLVDMLFGLNFVPD